MAETDIGANIRRAERLYVEACNSYLALKEQARRGNLCSETIGLKLNELKDYVTDFQKIIEKTKRASPEDKKHLASCFNIVENMPGKILELMISERLSTH